MDKIEEMIDRVLDESKDLTRLTRELSILSDVYSRANDAIFFLDNILDDKYITYEKLSMTSHGLGGGATSSVPHAHFKYEHVSFELEDKQVDKYVVEDIYNELTKYMSPSNVLVRFHIDSIILEVT